MPCNSIATVAIALKVGTLNELLTSADALTALQAALSQILGVEIRPSLRDDVCYFVPASGYSRYVMLRKAKGLELVGRFSASEQAQIQEFVNGLPAAMAEQAMVNAVVTQLQLLDDQPVYDQRTGVVIARELVVRV